MNKYRFAANLLAAKISGGSIPFQATINLLDSCNLQCEYCYNHYSDRGLKRLETARICSLVDEMKLAGCVKLNLAGGEPTIHPDFSEIVEKIVSCDIDCYVNSNGFFVRKHLEALKQVACLNISLDGPQNEHDMARGEGSFRKAIESLEIAVDEHIPRLITAVVGKHNQHAIDDLVGFSNQYSAPIVLLHLIPPRDGKASKFALGDEEIRGIFQDIEQRKKKGEPFVYSTKAIRHLLNWPHPISKDIVQRRDPEARIERSMKCYGGRFFCAIDTDGSLYPCCPSIGVLEDVPNITELSFDEAFKALHNHGCYKCNPPNLVDMNFLFDLSLPVIRNTLSVYK